MIDGIVNQSVEFDYVVVRDKGGYPGDKLAFWDVKTHQFLVEPGAFEVLIGSSSADIRLKGTFDVK